MKRQYLLALASVSMAAAQLLAVGQAPAQPKPLRVIAFGAHPDDAELKASGVAALWAAQGAKVKFVAMTNGDVGHFSSAGGPLAKRRKAEVAECARILGIENQVLDVHDGELVPSLENRKAVARLIREWQADIVLGHRPVRLSPGSSLHGRDSGRYGGRGRGAVLHAGYAGDAAQSRLHVLLRRVPEALSVRSDDGGVDRRGGRQEVAVRLGDAVAVRRQGLVAGTHAARCAAGRSGRARRTCSIRSSSAARRLRTSTASG